MSDTIQPLWHHAEFWITSLVGTAATVEDLARRTISNWLPATALAGGIVYQTWSSGWLGLGQSLLGAVVGFLVFLIFYVLGGMGGGDVKLMAGFGAVLGLSRVLWAAFWTALVGGILAAAVLGVAAVIARMKPASESKPSPVAIPYAPAIVAGVWLTLLSGN